MAKSGKRKIEQYRHDDKKRANNPPVGLVTPQTDKESGKKTYAYDPQLVWAGKAERTSFEVKWTGRPASCLPLPFLQAITQRHANDGYEQEL